MAIIMAGIAFGFHQLYKVSPPFPEPPTAAFSPFSPCPEVRLRRGARWRSGAGPVGREHP